MKGVQGVLAGLLMVPRPATRAVAEKLAKDLLDRHAHELAQTQREHLRAQGYDAGPCVCQGCSYCLAMEYIDLIDPRCVGCGEYDRPGCSTGECCK